MAYDDLIMAVEVSAQERVHEIQERSKAEAEEIIKSVQTKAGPIRKRHLDRAMTEVELQRNRLFSVAREENRLQLLGVKNEIYNEAFDEAWRTLALIREQPRYKASLKFLLGEVVRELGTKDIILHVDPRDLALINELRSECRLDSEVVPDLSCAGGLTANTRDERFLMINTLESRLKIAKEAYRPDIVSILFG